MPLPVVANLNFSRSPIVSNKLASHKKEQQCHADFEILFLFLDREISWRVNYVWRVERERQTL